jgi:hypothetical protein
LQIPLRGEAELAADFPADVPDYGGITSFL